MNRDFNVETQKFDRSEMEKQYLGLLSEYARKTVESEDALKSGLSDKYLKLESEALELKQKMNQILEIDASIAEEVKKLNRGLHKKGNKHD